MIGEGATRFQAHPLPLRPCSRRGRQGACSRPARPSPHRQIPRSSTDLKETLYQGSHQGSSIAMSRSTLAAWVGACGDAQPRVHALHIYWDSVCGRNHTTIRLLTSQSLRCAHATADRRLNTLSVVRECGSPDAYSSPPVLESASEQQG